MPIDSQQSVDWKTYVDAMWVEKDKAIAAALASAKEAVQVAEANSEKWRANANANEWRAAMTDRDRLYLARAEFQVYREETEKAVDELRRAQQTQEGVRKGLSDGWGWLVGAIGLVIAVATYFTKAT